MTLPAFEREAERVSDESDRASNLEEMARKDALDRATRAVEQQQRPRADGTYEVTECEECGEDIGAERLRLASRNLMCWHCATEMERKSKWYSN